MRFPEIKLQAFVFRPSYTQKANPAYAGLAFLGEMVSGYFSSLRMKRRTCLSSSGWTRSQSRPSSTQSVK